MNSPAKCGAFTFPGGDHINDFPVPILAKHYGVAVGTIGRWVSEDHIKGRRDPYNRRRKLYPLNAVQQAYDKRHTTT